MVASDGATKMPFVKSNRGLCVALVALVLLLATSQIARANMIYLNCGSDTFTVDLTNSTVDNNPATISTTAIDWQRTDYPQPGGSALNHFHIDRTTGTFTRYFTAHFPNGVVRDSPLVTQPCTVGSQPATKF